MTKFNMVENLHNQGSHQHWCGAVGHYYRCSEQCICICDLPMTGPDHTDCPVELRDCPEHAAQQEAGLLEEEPLPEGLVEITSFPDPQQRAVSHCQCGCDNIDASQIVGWCLWCNHVYVKWNLLIQDEHFAHHCPGAPAQSRQNAQVSLAKRQMKT
jgi:hypothetical protein